MTVPPRIVLFGVGAWGQNLLRIAAARGALAAIVDPAEQARTLASGRAPQTPVFSSLQELLHAGIPLDAALIATPARTHGALTQKLLEAGLDVFVEKPLTVSSQEALSLVELAHRRSRILMVGHLLRYHPAVERFLSEVAKGMIGDPIELFSWRSSPPGRLSDVNALWALAPHDLSILLALDRGLEMARANRTSSEKFAVHLEMSSGLIAHLELSRCHPNKQRRILLVGTEAALAFDDLNHETPLCLQRFRGCRLSTEEVLQVEQCEPLSAELDHFLECIQRRTLPLTPGSDGAVVVRWLEQIDSDTIAVDAYSPALSPALEDPIAR